MIIDVGLYFSTAFVLVWYRPYSVTPQAADGILTSRGVGALFQQGPIGRLPAPGQSPDGQRRC